MSSARRPTATLRRGSTWATPAGSASNTFRFPKKFAELKETVQPLTLILDSRFTEVLDCELQRLRDALIAEHEALVEVVQASVTKGSADSSASSASSDGSQDEVVPLEPAQVLDMDVKPPPKKVVLADLDKNEGKSQGVRLASPPPTKPEAKGGVAVADDAEIKKYTVLDDIAAMPILSPVHLHETKLATSISFTTAKTEEPRNTAYGRRKSYLDKVSREFDDGNFEAHPIWYEEPDAVLPGQTNPHRRSVLSFEDEQQQSDVDNMHPLLVFLQGFVVAPNSLQRLAWDFTCISFNVYDIVFLPLAFFGLDDDTLVGLGVLAWITRIFWTIDVPASFLTGYVTSTGNIALDLKPIARHYVRTWLWLDVLIVGSDWLVFIFAVASGAATARMGRTIRTLRMLRMLRLLRLVRMPDVARRLSERIVTDNTRVLGSITKIMMSVLGLAHIVACFWYGIGVGALPQEQSWVKLTQPPLTDPSVSFWDKYLLSLLWSLVKLAQGEMIIDPSNAMERCFVLSLSIFGFAVSAAAVSMITSSMTRFDILSSRETVRFQKLRQWMVDKHISPKLMARVQRNAQHALEEKRRNISESDVELLQLVSEPLRVELHFEVYSPLLAQHPFFAKFCKDNTAAMMQVCNTAVSLVGPFSRGDVIFTVGEVPENPRLLFVCSGHLAYTHHAAGKSELQHGQWIAEHTLWVPWRHCGTLRAFTEECRLLEMHSDAFQHSCRHFFSTSRRDDAVHPSNYALEFVKRLNKSDFSDLSDISTKETIQTDVQAAFPNRVRFHAQRITVTDDGEVGDDNAGYLSRAFRNLRDRLLRPPHIEIEDVDAVVPVHEKMKPPQDNGRAIRGSRAPNTLGKNRRNSGTLKPKSRPLGSPCASFTPSEMTDASEVELSRDLSSSSMASSLASDENECLPHPASVASQHQKHLV